MLIVLLIFTMIFSPIMMANEKAPEYKNIEVDKNGNLILTPDQYIQLANYIEELKADRDKYKAKYEQAMIELEKAYEEDNNSIDITKLTLTGAGIAALILLLAQNAN